MPPYNPELVRLPDDIPGDINKTPTSEEYRAQGGIIFEKDQFGRAIIGEEEHGRHKVYAGRGKVKAKLPRASELQEITVMLYGNSAEDVQTLIRETEVLQSQLKEGSVPKMEEHVAQALQTSDLLLPPRLPALPGFISSRSLPEDVTGTTTFLLSYGDRMEEYKRLDESGQTRFHAAVRAGLLPLVFPRSAAQDALFVDKLLDTAENNHKVAEYLIKKQTVDTRDNASPEVKVPKEYPDALTVFRRQLNNPYFILGLRGEATATSIEQAREESDRKLYEMFTKLVPEAPSQEAGRALILLHNILVTVVQKHALLAKELQTIFEVRASQKPQYADQAKKWPLSILKLVH